MSERRWKPAWELGLYPGQYSYGRTSDLIRAVASACYDQYERRAGYRRESVVKGLGYGHCNSMTALLCSRLALFGQVTTPMYYSCKYWGGCQANHA